MPTELLTSKLFIPPLRTSLVPRPRLVRFLNEGLLAKHKLTLISAPAGFGKTTLVVDWIKQTNLPTAWLSLDETDNDLQRFLTYLAAAFQQIDEELGGHLQSTLQAPRTVEADKLLPDLLNEIASRPDPLLLVLDDYHLIANVEILQAMEFLLRHQPPQLHLTITTREDPDLPLAKLRARNQLTEIRARDLRFTQEETDIFLREVMGLHLSQKNVTVLEDRTEGWAVGLQLAGLSMQKHTDLQSFIAEFSGSHRHILDYLTDEVLQQQPEDIRTFLLQTAILDRLDGSLCDAVTGRTDSSNLLAQLEAANLFMIPLDEERRWYRYHHLFSDLLRNQLIRSQRESIPELHRRASRWHEEYGDIREAVDHALQDTDLTQAAQLIEHYTLPKLYQGQIAMVVSWFDRLPARVLESAPMLCIGKAWALALMQRGARRDEIEPAIEAANRALQAMPANQQLRDLIHGHSASIRAFLLRSPWVNETRQRLIALSQEAQSLLPIEEKAIRSINDLNIAYAYLGLADLDAARVAFEQALEEGLTGHNFYAAIYGPINLVLSALMVGRRNEAIQLCDANIDRFNRLLAGQYFPPMGALYILKGSILLEHNQLADAEQLVSEGLDLIRWTGESVAHRTGYSALARARAIQGDQAGMLEALKALEETLPREMFYAGALRHRLLMRHWPSDADAQRNAGTWLSASGIKFGERTVIRSLNPASAAEFESNLNAACVMIRLAKTNPDAYSLDGLHEYLEGQMQFAKSHGIINWVVMVAIVQTQLLEAEGKKETALEVLDGAMRVAVTTGLFRIFLDEGESLGALLATLKPRTTNRSLIAYINRLLEAFRMGIPKPEPGEKQVSSLSAREFEVLQHLARGSSYEEIGQELFLSLNTIQSHVKSIYRKLLVNKRMQAIERAREMKLI
jgi:LuxR family maltose regulon positive regulatory protein